MVAHLKGACHASFSTIRKFFRDTLKVSSSRGQLAKVIQKVSEAMAASHQALREALPRESTLNVDETGHKLNGKRHWTWCFRSLAYTVFKIDPSRGSQVLLDALGDDFNGTIGCDYYRAYHVTQGTRSQRGSRWCERIWTAIATCAPQNRSVYEFLRQSIGNHLAGQPTPSLLPSGP